jgi:hypothetical protein
MSGPTIHHIAAALGKVICRGGRLIVHSHAECWWS